MAFRPQLRKLLKEYSLEDLCERAGLEVIDALEALVDYGYIDISDIVEPVDDET